MYRANAVSLVSVRLMSGSVFALQNAVSVRTQADDNYNFEMN